MHMRVCKLAFCMHAAWAWLPLSRPCWYPCSSVPSGSGCALPYMCAHRFGDDADDTVFGTLHCLGKVAESHARLEQRKPVDRQGKPFCFFSNRQAGAYGINRARAVGVGSRSLGVLLCSIHPVRMGALLGHTGCAAWSNGGALPVHAVQ